MACGQFPTLHSIFTPDGRVFLQLTTFLRRRCFHQGHVSKLKKSFFRQLHHWVLQNIHRQELIFPLHRQTTVSGTIFLTIPQCHCLTVVQLRCPLRTEKIDLPRAELSLRVRSSWIEESFYSGLRSAMQDSINLSIPWDSPGWSTGSSAWLLSARPVVRANHLFWITIFHGCLPSCRTDCYGWPYVEIALVCLGH